MQHAYIVVTLFDSFEFVSEHFNVLNVWHWINIEIYLKSVQNECKAQKRLELIYFRSNDTLIFIFWDKANEILQVMEFSKMKSRMRIKRC